MRRVIALFAVAVAGLAGPASACMNDRATPSQEREFRSQYRDPAPAARPEPDPYAPPAPARSPILARHRDSLLLGSGVALLGGAFVVAGRRRVLPR